VPGGATTGSIAGMTAKLSVSLTEETYRQVREYAASDGVTISAWLDRAARREAHRRIVEAHAAAVCAAEADLLLTDAVELEDELSAARAELRGGRAAQG